MHDLTTHEIDFIHITQRFTSIAHSQTKRNHKQSTRWSSPVLALVARTSPPLRLAAPCHPPSRRATRRRAFPLPAPGRTRRRRWLLQLAGPRPHHARPQPRQAAAHRATWFASPRPHLGGREEGEGGRGLGEEAGRRCRRRGRDMGEREGGAGVK